MAPSLTGTFTSPATRPFASVMIAPARSGPAAIVNPATSDVAAKVRRGNICEPSFIALLSTVFTIVAVFAQCGRVMHAARNRASEAVGRGIAELHQAIGPRFGKRTASCCQRKHGIAVEGRMYRTDRARKTVRRHDRKPL